MVVVERPRAARYVINDLRNGWSARRGGIHRDAPGVRCPAEVIVGVNRRRRQHVPAVGKIRFQRDGPLAVRPNHRGADFSGAAVEGDRRAGLARSVDGRGFVVGETVLADRTGDVERIILHACDDRGLCRGDVRRVKRRGRAGVSGGIGGICGQGFAVGFRRDQINAEITLIVGDRFPDLNAIFTNGDGAARLGCTGYRGAVGRDHHVFRCQRWRAVWRVGKAGRTGVAATVGGRHCKGFAVGLGWRNRDGKGAVRTGGGLADDRTVRRFNNNRAVWLGGSADACPVFRHHQVTRCGRRGDVRCVNQRRGTLVACGIGGDHGDDLAVHLCRVQVGDVVAVAVGSGGPDLHPGVVGDDNFAARLGSTGDLRACRIERRLRHVWRRKIDGKVDRLRQAALVACRIGRGGGNGVVSFRQVGRRGKAPFPGSIGRGGADRLAVVIEGNNGASFTDATERRACIVRALSVAQRARLGAHVIIDGDNLGGSRRG